MVTWKGNAEILLEIPAELLDITILLKKDSDRINEVLSEKRVYILRSFCKFEYEQGAST